MSDIEIIVCGEGQDRAWIEMRRGDLVLKRDLADGETPEDDAVREWHEWAERQLRDAKLRRL